MNYLAHHEVAAHLSDQPDFLFGSVVADLARMCGSRRALHEITNPQLAAGNIIHRLTNKVFDNYPPIKQLEEEMIASFKWFLPWREATQAARAGKDLLFDGTQFVDSQKVNKLMNTFDQVLSSTDRLSQEGLPDNLWQLVDRIRSRGVPDYSETEIATGSLIKVLSKTRTPIPAPSYDQVAVVMDKYKVAVVNLGEAAMSYTVSNLKNQL
jgi:acyl carrier protein phosphodiesterase